MTQDQSNFNKNVSNYFLSTVLLTKLWSPGRDIELIFYHFILLPHDIKSLPQVRKSFPQVRKSFPQDSKSFPEDNKSLPQNIKLLPQDTNSFPQISKVITTRY